MNAAQYAHDNGLPIDAYKASGLPLGLTMDIRRGVISGICNESNVSQVRVAAHNSAGWSGWRGFTITVSKNVPYWDRIPVQSAKEGDYFSFSLAPYVHSDAGPIQEYWSSPLPQGLDLNAATGLITGSPAPGQAQTWYMTVKARNQFGWSGAAQLTIVLVQPSPPANPRISINGGAAHTNDPKVRLSLHADNMLSSDSMRITYTGGGDTGWISYATSKQITLKQADGKNTV